MRSLDRFVALKFLLEGVAQDRQALEPNEANRGVKRPSVELKGIK